MHQPVNAAPSAIHRFTTVLFHAIYARDNLPALAGAARPRHAKCQKALGLPWDAYRNGSG